MSSGAWELVFMLLILKIPMVYLALVVWYAIRAEPEPGVDPTESSVWRPWRKPEDPRPRRGGRARGRGPRARAGRATGWASRVRGGIGSRGDLDDAGPHAALRGGRRAA